MITKHLSIRLLLTSRSLKEPFTQEIQYTGLEKNYCIEIHCSNRLVNFLVRRKHELVVTHTRLNYVGCVLVGVGADWLVEDLVTDYVWLVRHIGSNNLPHSAEMVKQTILIAEKVLLEFHEVIG